MFYDSSSRFDFMSDQICFFSPLINRLLLISRQTEIWKSSGYREGSTKTNYKQFIFFVLDLDCVFFIEILDELKVYWNLNQNFILKVPNLHQGSAFSVQYLLLCEQYCISINFALFTLFIFTLHKFVEQQKQVWRNMPLCKVIHI